MTCPFGLTETAVPVKLGEKVIGYLRIGQVYAAHAVEESDAAKVGREHVKPWRPIHRRDSRRTGKKDPLIPPEKYNAIVRLLTFFARAALGFDQSDHAGKREC